MANVFGDNETKLSTNHRASVYTPIEGVWQTKSTTAATHLNCRNHWTRLISCGCDIDCSSSVPQILAWRPTPPRVHEVGGATINNHQSMLVTCTAEDGIQGERREKLIS